MYPLSSTSRREMYPEYKKHLRRTTAIVHHDHYQVVERQSSVSRSKNRARRSEFSERSQEKNLERKRRKKYKYEDKPRKMSSKNTISKFECIFS